MGRNMMQLNKVDYTRQPKEIPDTDEGSLRLYYELELLRSNYESEKLEKQLQRYTQIIDVLGERGLFVPFNTDLEIDKATRKSDWYNMISKPIPKPGKKEKQKDYISRCMSAIGGEYEDNEQAVAICHNTWRESKKSDEPAEEPRLPVEKPELHIHLDGSVEKEKTIEEQYAMEKLELIKMIKQRVLGETT